MHEHVAALRRFNRSFTQRIGVLDDSFLGSGRPLGPSRLLYEIGRDGAGILDLRERLSLDSGYVSRLLRQLESEGLVTVDVDPTDGRRRTARLTDLGLEVWSDLDRRSDELAERLVSPLSPRRRAELSAALATADRLLRAATVTLDVVDPSSDDAIWAMTQYFDELDDRFPTGFDPETRLSPTPPPCALPRARSSWRIVMAGRSLAAGCARSTTTRQRSSGCGSPTSCAARGLGQRMLAFLEDCARQLGFHRVLLDTNSTLLEAITMYERAGYESIERYSDNPYAARWFARPLE